MSNPKDYRLNVKLKNNRLLSAIEAKGFETPGAFAKQEGIAASFVYNLVNMKETPTTSQGDLRKWITEICEALDVLPEDIFSEQQMNEPIKNNSFDVEVSRPELEALMVSKEDYSLEDSFSRIALGSGMNDAISTLTSREQKVIDWKFGIEDGDEKTLEEMGDNLNLSRERIRQIEAKALRKLRHPSRWGGLDGYLSEPNQKKLEEYRVN